MRIDGTTMTLASGVTYALSSWDGAIDHVTLRWGERIDHCGLPKDHHALITSILVTTGKPVSPIPDLGQLLFQYNKVTRFTAPIVALMNRYHGLTSLQGLLNRFRLVVNPQMAIEDLCQERFSNGIVEPIELCELLTFELLHEPPADAVLGVDSALGITEFTVEFQTMTSPAAFLIWKTEVRRRQESSKGLSEGPYR